MASQTGNDYIYGTVKDSVEIPTSILRWWRPRFIDSQMTATTTDYHKLQCWRPKRLYCHFSSRQTQICRWNCHPICQSSRDI